MIENKEEEKDPKQKVKERALLILKNKEKRFPFVESEVFEKSKKLITEFDEMGGLPEIVAYLAFFQANRILNKYHYKNERIFDFSDKDRTES